MEHNEILFALENIDATDSVAHHDLLAVADMIVAGQVPADEDRIARIFTDRVEEVLREHSNLPGLTTALSAVIKHLTENRPPTDQSIPYQYIGDAYGDYADAIGIGCRIPLNPS